MFVVIVLIHILVPISVSAATVIIFDWIFGTSYFSAPVVGIVALIIFITGRMSN
jgi:hypothetical protein